MLVNVENELSDEVLPIHVSFKPIEEKYWSRYSFLPGASKAKDRRRFEHVFGSFTYGLPLKSRRAAAIALEHDTDLCAHLGQNIWYDILHLPPNEQFKKMEAHLRHMRARIPQALYPDSWTWPSIERVLKPSAWEKGGEWVKNQVTLQIDLPEASTSLGERRIFVTLKQSIAGYANSVQVGWP